MSRSGSSGPFPCSALSGLRVVGVVGTSTADEAISATAYGVGRLLAEAGCVVVCGGLGGVMEAVCRGAKSASGLTIGILPGAARGDANPYVDVAIATGIGEARNFVIVRTADALIAVGGGYGTLSEISFALATGKRVVGLDTWEAAVGGRDAGILRASTPEEAVQLVLS